METIPQLKLVPQTKEEIKFRIQHLLINIYKPQIKSGLFSGLPSDSGESRIQEIIDLVERL